MRTFLICAVLALAACGGNRYTAIQQQDAADALACVREARELVARNAPASAILAEIPDTAAVGNLVPSEARDWRDMTALLALAETSLFSVNEEFRTRPLQHERARQAVIMRDWNYISTVAAQAKAQAGHGVIDKWSIQLWGVGFVSVLLGVSIWGILAYLRSKNPAAEMLFKKFIGAFQISRTETPLEIAKEISARFEGIDVESAKDIVRNALDNSLRAKLPSDVQDKIKELKEKIGLKVS